MAVLIFRESKVLEAQVRSRLCCTHQKGLMQRNVSDSAGHTDVQERLCGAVISSESYNVIAAIDVLTER